MDLTRGSLRRSMLLFALPLVLTSVFKHSFSFADTLIVSRFCSADALSAISLAGSLYSLMVAVVNGFGVGSSIVIGKVFGEGRRAKDAAFTLLLLGGGFSFVLAAACMRLAKPYAVWIQAPEGIVDLTAGVLRMYAFGIVFYGVSLVASCLLNGLGDSRTTFMIFSVSSALNVLLDLAAVLVFRAGIMGCVMATLLAQLYSAVHMFICLRRRVGEECNFRFHPAIIQETLAIGSTSIVQESLFNVLAILAQSLVVPFGTNYINGYSIGRQIISIFSTAVNGYCRGYSTALAQNYGARRLDRVVDAMRISKRDGNLCCALLSTLSLLLARPLSVMILSTANETAVRYAMVYIGLSLPGYFLALHTQRATALLRVCKMNRMVMFSGLLTMAIRALCLYPIVNASVWLLPLSDFAGRAAALWYLLWRAKGIARREGIDYNKNRMCKG